MSILRIFDVSAYIHAGKVNKRAGIDFEPIQTDRGYVPRWLPTGGVSFLFNAVNLFHSNSFLVFAFDRNPLMRKSVNPEYKSNRISDPSIVLMQDLAEFAIQECGFNCCAEDKYEADDVIYTICTKYKSEFSHIYIHSNDSDVFMNVNEKVSIAPVRSNDKEVNLDNYEMKVNSSRITPYNECNYYKLLYGDKADNYGGIKDSSLLNRIINFSSSTTMQSNLGDSVVYGSYIKSLLPEAYPQFLLAYPQLISSDIDIYLEPDWEAINMWGWRVGNSGFTFSNVNKESIKYKRMMDYINNLGGFIEI